MKANLKFLWAMLIMLPLMFVSVAAVAQTTASGTVTSSNGEPLIGVTVLEQGTTNGTITDLDGKFSLNVQSGATLEFSFMGYEKQSAPASSNMNIKLEEDTKALEEVVVVGYGTQRKEAVTGSVASVKGDDMRAVAGSNITQNLQGRVAGVEMSQVSSKPGETMQIRIRGTRSLNASNDPLIVLDGIPFAGNLSDINPSDIKSLDILKDASATAIYGSRGANGVIIITTNRGSEGQKAKFTYNGYYGVKKLFSKFPMMNAGQFRQLRDAAGKSQNSIDEAAENSVDWQDLYFETGMVTSHDVGVTGGTQAGNYSFGVGYYHEEAVVPGQDFSRFSLRGSVDQKIGDYFKVGFSTNNNYSVTNDCNQIFTILAASPIVNIYNEDGTIKDRVDNTDGTRYVVTADRVNDLGDKYANQRKVYGSYNTFYGEAELPYVKGLKYRVNVGLNLRYQNNGNYQGVGIFSGTPSANSTASITNSLTTNWAVENLITYDKIFAEKHSINFVAMYSAEASLYNSSNVGARDIQADHFQYWNLGRADGPYTVNPDYQGYSKTGLISYMARLMYSYDSKYMLSVALRSDGSSRLAEGHKWHTYPAVSLGWNVKNEEFMSGITWLNQLKIRLGYGETSNQSVDPYKTLGRLGTNPYNFGDKTATGLRVTEVPNAELGWEYSSTWNLGLDLGFFHNRLNVTAEYYAMKTKDVLLSIGLPSTSGVSSIMSNIGETENKGFEMSIDGTIIDNRNGWTWTAGANFYINRNKLTKLASGQTEDRGNSWFVGKPIDCIYDFKYEGLWQENEEEVRKILEPAGAPGMIKVAYTGEYDANGLPVREINDDDKIPQSMECDLQGGFNTTVSWKNIDLNVVGSFKVGGLLISTLYGSSGYLNLMTTKNNNVKVDYWTPTNTDARYPAPGGIQSGDNPKYSSTLGYFDASYLKIRTITLGYNFDQLSVFRNTNISKLRLYFSVVNPFVMFSPYRDESGMDPETNSYGNENAASSQYQKRLLTIGTNTPSTRTYMFGLNFTF
ncbi:MAG: TonB-dependent receptor [Bacteroidales bacterium]|nr:TonB-dependent receptor [Bacteroidales bacterium]